MRQFCPIVDHCCQTTIWSKLSLVVCVRAAAHTSVRSNSHHMPSVCSLGASRRWEVLLVTLAYPALRWGHVCRWRGVGVSCTACVCMRECVCAHRSIATSAKVASALDADGFHHTDHCMFSLSLMCRLYRGPLAFFGPLSLSLKPPPPPLQ